MLSALAGLTFAGGQFVAASFAILGFVGIFLTSCVLAKRFGQRDRLRFLLGLTLAVVAPVIAISIGANPVFFVVGSLAALPGLLGAYLAYRLGFQSLPALTFFVGALALAAPCAAVAGGASYVCAFGLLILLLPFFCWRTVEVRKSLSLGGSGGRQGLKRVGMRESAYATLWTFFVVTVAHLIF